MTDESFEPKPVYDKILNLSRWDVQCLRRILRRQQKKCLSEIRKHEERGWKPQPGHLDLSRTILQQVNGMLSRLGYPEDVQPEPKEGLDL